MPARAAAASSSHFMLLGVETRCSATRLEAVLGLVRDADAA